MVRLRLLGILCAVAILTSAGTIVWSNQQDHEQSCANRLAIVQAFDIYTDALIAAAGRNDDRSPQEEKDRAEAIVEFRSVVHKELAPLRAGCG